MRPHAWLVRREAISLLFTTDCGADIPALNLFCVGAGALVVSNGMALTSGVAVIASTNFSSNSAEAGILAMGGAFYSRGTDVTLTDTRFTGRWTDVD